jgi:hypothetical protein
MGAIEGIYVDVLGDFGPFSRTGKSIGYQVRIGDLTILVDCGAPLFDAIGGHGLQKVNGLCITHCHDDHKRWFSDLALFHRYAPDMPKTLFLLTSEAVYKGVYTSAMTSIERSLSVDSKKIVDMSFDDFITTKIIGPRAKYHIDQTVGQDGTSSLAVVDSDGTVVPPQRAKVILSQKDTSPRMLMKDPDTGLWIEPESFYAFSSSAFYEDNKGVYESNGVTIEAHKAPVWHGIQNIGIKFSTANESLFFTSDTVHDTELWKTLSTELRAQKLPCSAEEFEELSIVRGDINDLIECAWSQERYDEAIKCFEGSVVVQDVSAKGSVVHTDYERLEHTVLDKELTLLTHCPDRMTSQWGLCYTGKTYLIQKGKILEVVGDKLYHPCADIYHKEKGRFYVGFKNEKGKYRVHMNEEKTVRMILKDPYVFPDIGEHIFNVDLYEDVGGEYFPVLEEEGATYRQREDGKVEIVWVTQQGSTGRVVEGLRSKINPPV